ncbi:MAG: autotransporter outer membrane beta-barrel domain-containing protein [Pseudomonadales bacterium]
MSQYFSGKLRSSASAVGETRFAGFYGAGVSAAGVAAGGVGGVHGFGGANAAGGLGAAGAYGQGQGAGYGAGAAALRGAGYTSSQAGRMVGSSINLDLPDEFEFSLASMGAAGGSGGSSSDSPLEDIVIWGRAFHQSLEVEEGATSFDGDTSGLVIGFDMPGLRPGLLLGLAISEANAESDFRQGESVGTQETDLTTFHPYFGWQMKSGSQIWGSIGLGSGDSQVVGSDSPDNIYKREVNTQSINLGASRPLRVVGLASSSKNQVLLSLTGDVTYSGIEEDGEGGMNSGSTRVRAGFDLDLVRPLSDGGEMGSRLDVALRHDFGDLYDGIGVEVGTGIDFSVPDMGLRLDLEARTLLAHNEDVKEWGISGGILWMPKIMAQGHGLTLAFRPQYGAGTARQADKFLEAAVADYNQFTNAASASTEDTDLSLGYNWEIKYGLPLSLPLSTNPANLTFFTKSEVRQTARALTLGIDMQLGPNLTAGYETTKRQSNQATTEKTPSQGAYIRYKKVF